MFHLIYSRLNGAGATEAAVAVVVVDHDDGAGPKVLTVAPRKPLQRQRVFPPVLLVRVGVVAAVQAVNHHRSYFRRSFVLSTPSWIFAEAAVPLTCPTHPQHQHLT